MINITKTFLPPIDEYNDYLEKIWTSNQLTNNGPLVQKLEEDLAAYLCVNELFFVNNGTTALQISLKALSLQGDIITTPFSYIATTSSIIWENCRPIFVDINPGNLCINPKLIEDALTDNTVAILATHVYGIPCQIEEISQIANKHNLLVIYDAAHTFGVKYRGKNLVSFGDISTLSFHATKIFHTVEGGAIIVNKSKFAHKVSYMRNFGHKGNGEYWGLGINGKNSEFHAAMGLCLLPKVNGIIESRKKLTNLYNRQLKDIDLLNPVNYAEFEYNYSYYPRIFPSETKLLAVEKELNKNNIFPRRYFYPSLNLLSRPLRINTQDCPISEDISRRVLCLPLYDSLKPKDVKHISNIIRTNL